MRTLQDEMPRVVWRSSLSTLVRICSARKALSLLTCHLSKPEMLTPIDQPLDKLEDLTKDEM